MTSPLRDADKGVKRESSVEKYKSSLCPFCGSGDSWKNGHKPDGTQRYLCKNCGREYTEKTHKSPEHLQTIQARSLNTPAPTLVLAGEAEKHGEIRVGGGAGAEERKMQSLKNSNSDLLKAFPTDIQAKLLQFAIKRFNKNKGYKSIIYGLRTLINNGADLHDPASVKGTIARARWKDSYKKRLVSNYNVFLEFLGGTWDRPEYNTENGTPFVPYESEIDQLIAATSKKVSVALQMLKETGARIGEVGRVLWTEIDLKRKTVAINHPEKGSNPRVLPISNKLIAMLNTLARQYEKIFPNIKSVAGMYYNQRRRIAYRLGDPRLLKIGLKEFRHFKGTMEYHKTKDIMHVKYILGHKNIQNTMIYIHIEKMLFLSEDEQFVSKVAESISEAQKLVEAGFDYVTTFDNMMLFRKRK